MAYFPIGIAVFIVTGGLLFGLFIIVTELFSPYRSERKSISEEGAKE
jgi:hypothetical protein